MRCGQVWVSFFDIVLSAFLDNVTTMLRELVAHVMFHRTNCLGLLHVRWRSQKFWRQSACSFAMPSRWTHGRI